MTRPDRIAPYTGVPTGQLVTVLDRARSARRLGGAARRLVPERLARYRDDPAGFVANVLGEHLWSAERRIMEAVRDHRHVAVKSCHEVGKSFTASRVVAWWLSVHEAGEAFAVTTAPSFPQVRAILWREIARAHKAGDLPGYLNQTEWWQGEIVGFGRKPRTAVDEIGSSAFQGIHARKVLVVIDEAAGVDKALYDAAEGLIGNEASRMLAIGHPDDPGSEFAAKIDRWHTIEIGAFDSPNFTDEEVPIDLAELLVSPLWVEERRAEWTAPGPEGQVCICPDVGCEADHSPLWWSRVLGKFPPQAKDSLYPVGWVQRAMDQDLETGFPVVVSADIARFGDNRTIVAVRRGPVVRFVAEDPYTPTTKATTMIEIAMEEAGAEYAAVDEAGIGGGVVDELRADRVRVLGLLGGSAPKNPKRFVNARSEWHWELRDALRLGEVDLPDDQELLTEMTAIKYKLDGKGRIVVESKAEMAKRGMRSPDKLDTVVYAFAQKKRQWVSY